MGVMEVDRIGRDDMEGGGEENECPQTKSVPLWRDGKSSLRYGAGM